jgi:hypothetical protein
MNVLKIVVYCGLSFVYHTQLQTVLTNLFSLLIWLQVEQHRGLDGRV